MILQLTDFAVGVLATVPAPVLDVFKIGSAFNYVPLSTDTNIHGTTLFTGAITPPLTLNANVVKYTVSMDTSIGDFDWGEVGLFYQGQLFALAVGNSLEHKAKVGATPGNQVRLDAFLTIVGTNYNMIVDQADSSNQFQMASLSTIDQLPPSNQTTPNSYIISAPDSTQSSFLAYTDRTGLWNFDAFQFSTGMDAVVRASDTQSITINLLDYSADMSPDYFGQVALEFVTGRIYSICRYVKTAVASGSTVVLGFQTPLAIQPNVGDKVTVYVRLVQSADLQIPIATASLLGGIKIGAGLIVQPDGTCSVDAATLNAVTSVNGKGPGDITLAADDIAGISAVGKSGLYTDLIGAPGPYTLPIANTSVLGGVKAPSNGNLIISAGGVLDLGFSPVKTVNGVIPDAGGNVNVTANVIGLVNPTTVTSGTDLNALNTTGLFTIASGVVSTLVNAPMGAVVEASTLEVVPTVNGGVGYSIQRFTNSTSLWWRAGTGVSWGAWNQVSTQAIATTSTLGVVKIGTGLSVALDGTLSWSTSSLPTASGSVPGVIKVGTGLTIDGSGVLNATPYALPIASASVLGGIKIGAGLTIDGTGLLKTNLLTVNGLSPDGAGNINVSADSNKLDKVNGVATGVFLTYVDLGTKAAGSTVAVVAATANVQRATFTGGSVTWTYTWPAGSIYAEVQMDIINGGLATHTFPAAVKWYNPDGTIAANFAAYIGNKRSGATNFQTAGIDFAIFWSHDAGTTIYAMIL